jgi:hypothetical protein
MALGDIFSSLIGQLFREVAQDAAHRGLSRHANRRRPGAETPTSAHFGKLVVALGAALTAALWLAFAWLALVATALRENDRTAGLLISGFLGVLALLALWETLARRIDWTETSVRFRTWTGERTRTWDDIVGLEEKSYPPRLRLTFRDGKGFTFYETMNNSRYFRYLVETRIAPPDGSKRSRRRQRGRKIKKT